MTQLASRLSGLFKLARSRHSPQQTTLGHGLTVRAHHQLPRLCLWRERGEWQPGEAAEREGRVCAEQLGWQNFTLRWQGRYLIVEDGGGLL